MVKKALFVALLVSGLFLAASPAMAYVELVLAPAGWEIGDDAASITVMVSDEFELVLSIQSDETVDTIGIDAYLYFDASQIEAQQVGDAYPDYPDPVVDDSVVGRVFDPTKSLMPQNSGDNTSGSITYVQQTAFGSTVQIVPGVNIVGVITFHCKAVGTSNITVDEMSWLYDEMDPETNLFTSFHGTEVINIVPEPTTLILLGCGLIMGGFAYRRKK